MTPAQIEIVVAEATLAALYLCKGIDLALSRRLGIGMGRGEPLFLQHRVHRIQNVDVRPDAIEAVSARAHNWRGFDQELDTLFQSLRRVLILPRRNDQRLNTQTCRRVEKGAVRGHRINPDLIGSR